MWANIVLDNVLVNQALVLTGRKVRKRLYTWLYALMNSQVDLGKNLKAKIYIMGANDIIASTQVVNEVCINFSV